MALLDFRNTNTLWCSVLAETLARRGVRYAVISPGSRSTPLTLALVAHPEIETIPVLDERSAAFFALGLAKRTGRPTVLVCTSGTAGANYFPAVIEAAESATPLMVITADRPPEMRDCASGQTIDQQKLFGGFVRFYHELAVPEAQIGLLRYLRQTVAQAVDCASEGGPVHLNAPFRDPLPAIPDQTARGLENLDWATFFESPQVIEPEPIVDAVLTAADAKKRGIIVAGNDWPLEAVGALAEDLRWPVLADALAPARLRSDGRGVVVAAYDAILRDSRAARTLAPELVVVLGEIPTSKTLRAWLSQLDLPIVQLTQKSGNRDGLHGRTKRVHLSAGALNGLAAAGERCSPDWSARWVKAEGAAQSVLARVREVPAFEGAFTRVIAESLTRDQALVVASSMPVRDLEYLAPLRCDGPSVFSNRGANGIDGTLSTALGVAHGGTRTVLLTGDLALLHDTNGFLLTAKFKGALTIVVINNAGGGIFGHLPVAKDNPAFEEYWATPQQVDLGKLAAAYGVSHQTVDTPENLRQLLTTQSIDSGVRVIEVRTNRANDVATRQRLFADAARCAGDALA